MLVPGVCTQCGATLSVDNEKDAMVCPYCKTPFVIEKAINKYSVVNNINAQNVFVQGSINQEFEIRGGVLVKYNGSSLDVVIPSGVVKVGDKAFEGLMIESVVLGEDVEELGIYAFKNCRNLKSFTFNSKLSNMSMPFKGCENLETIYVPSALLGKTPFVFGTIFTEENEEPCDGRLQCDCKKLVNIYVDGEKLSSSDKRLVYFPSTPLGFPLFLEKRIKERELKEEEIRRGWMSKGLCQYCGGTFKGFIIKKCERCNKNKDY